MNTEGLFQLVLKNGPAVFRKAAEDAARKARFVATTLSGTPIRVTGVITYNFVRR